MEVNFFNGKTLVRRKLNDIMEFYHVVRVRHFTEPGPFVEYTKGIWAPELYGDEIEVFTYIPEQPSGWRLMNGYSGQYGYSGPLMHQSEFIGGRMAEDIMGTPGLYVAVYQLDEEDPTEWAVAYIHN